MATSQTTTPQVVLANDSTQHASTVIQQATTGSTSAAATWAESLNSSFPAQVVKGAGKITSFRNTSGTEIAAVNQDGPFGFKGWMFQYLEPAGTLFSTIDGRTSGSGTSANLTTGTVYVTAAPIESGVKISNLTYVSLTAEATGTHAWVGLADSTGKVLAISADNTGAAYFAANTAVTTALASAFTTTYTGLHYVFICVVASGTVPTFVMAPAFAHVAVPTIAPIVCGTTLTAQTTPVAVGSSLGTITPTTGHQLYCYGT